MERHEQDKNETRQTLVDDEIDDRGTTRQTRQTKHATQPETDKTNTL